MLSVDLVQARRQKDRLHVTPLGERTERAREIADALVSITEAFADARRDELEAAWKSVEGSAREEKLRDGLIQLLEGELEFETKLAEDPVALRALVFQRAALRRRESDAPLSRDALLDEIGKEKGVDASALEEGLYADLRGAERLKTTRIPGGANAIVNRFDLAQAQAVLLRATKLIVELDAAQPQALRQLLRQLKFHRLLFAFEPDGRISVDGPSALFESTTKYGMALANALPHVLACRPMQIEVDVRWGKERLPLRYVIDRSNPLLRDAEKAGAEQPSDEVQTLLEKLREKAEGFEVTLADRVLDIPGAGVIVPDLVLKHRKTRREVFIEVLGFWSRDAVWKRIELAQRGLKSPIVFCAGQRLRVSEAALDESTHASLYVYKGVISASQVMERVERLIG